MFPLRFRLRSLMILVIPTVAIGAWTYRVLPKCSVHGTVMWRENVPIGYGLVMFSAQDSNTIRRKPRCSPTATMLCWVAALSGSERTMSKNICRTCNATRAAWRLSQTKPTPTISAPLAGSNSGGSATSNSN